MSQEVLLDSKDQSYIGKQPKTHKVGFLITLPVFIGYACCFSLQKDLSKVFGLTEGISGDSRSKIYGIGTSFVYFFNLLFRILGHNLVFGCLKPKNRVIAALVSCSISMIMLSFLSFQESPPSLAWIFISYAFMGVCEGSYGPNMLNVVNKMDQTRIYVILAMPTGVACITLGAFALIPLGIPFQAFYITNAVLTILGIIIYLFTIYRDADDDDPGSNFDIKQFLYDFKELKEWLPRILLHSIVFIVNMFCLSLFNPGCTLYTYQNRVTYRLFGFTLDQHWFMFIYNLGGFLGDLISRKVMDKKKIINPLFYFLMLCFAALINFMQIPEICPIASFYFMWANGGLYSQSTKKIGEEFKDGYHLTATSTWLFFGDAGSTGGANVVQLIRPFMTFIKKQMY